VVEYTHLSVFGPVKYTDLYDDFQLNLHDVYPGSEIYCREIVNGIGRVSVVGRNLYLDGQGG
jgi:hypothetical protein